MIITAAIAAFAMAQNGTQEMRLLRYPNVHGNSVLFTYASDLWTADMSGGLARRLTSSSNNEVRARYSPDGSLIAFTGNYDGNDDVYVMPSDGGEPKRLTFDSIPENVVGWTPDGSKIAYTTRSGSNFGQQPRLYLVSKDGGLPESTPVLEAAEVSFSPDGSKIVYNRKYSDLFNWRHYRGGTQGRISFFDLKSGAYSELPNGDYNSYAPMWIGDSIYFISDRELDCINLYRYDLGSKSTKRLTDFNGGDIKWPSTDGKTIVFERDGYLYSYDVATDKLQQLDPQVRSDDVLAHPTLKKLGPQISYVSLSPSGARIAAEARGEIFSVPVKSGDTRNLTNTPESRERFPTWSPDGQTIAYASDAGGTWQLYTMPQMGGTPTKITDFASTEFTSIAWSPNSKKIAFSTRDYVFHVADVATKTTTDFDMDDQQPIQAFDWSPDSNWIAYIKTAKDLYGSVWLYNLSTGKKSQITDGYFRDDSIAFDLSGKYIYIISGREVEPGGQNGDFNVSTQSLRQRVYMLVLSAAQENPLMPSNDEEPVATPPTPGAPTKPADQGSGQGAGNKQVPQQTQIDVPNLGDRLIPLPFDAGTYSFIIGLNNGVLVGSPSGIQKFDVDSREVSPFFSGPVEAASVNPSGTKLAYKSGPVIGVVDIRPGAKVGDGAVNTNDVEAVVDLRKEWTEMYWDAWRHEASNYYDKNMRGLDWKAVGDHYAAMLPYVSSRGDLTYVIGLLIAELGTSHTYTGGGDPGIPSRPVPVGHLGADYEIANGKVRIKRIYRGASFYEARRGPLGDPGVSVKEGDYLLAIDGKPIDDHTNPNSLMVDKAGKYVTLTVNSSPSMDGARKVRVRPIADETQLRYQEWISGNAKMVSQLSGGRIGYVHVPDTSTSGAIEFVKGFYANVDKDAIVVDERFNGGGSIPTPWIDILSRNYETYFRQRHGTDTGLPFQSIDGPKCMLINGYAGSGGDMFPYLFRRQKIGPLIGERTWGGLVGYNEQYALQDGGWVTAPEAAFYEPRTGKWIAENHGIDPDIAVDSRPDLLAQGQDPQLHEAVNYLLKQLKDHPVQKNKRPEPIPLKK